MTRGSRPSSALIRLGLMNAVGYSVSGATPFWIGAIGDRYGLPPWSGALCATLQLICTAVMNIATPWLFRSRPKRIVGAAAAGAAVLGNLIVLLPGAAAFAIGAAIAGGAVGVLLNTTNRIAAETESPGRSYSVYEIAGVAVSMSLYMVIPYVYGRFGFPAIFLLLAGVSAATCVEFFVVPLPTRQDIEPGSPAEARLAVPSTGSLVRKAVALAAMFLMFVGQSSVSANLVPLGHAVALEMTTVGRVMALGLVVSLAGGFLARAVAGRMGLTAPIVIGGLALAIDAIVVTSTHLSTVYIGFVVFYFVCIVFITPFAFSILARVDRSGRVASIGPAFLMVGVAMGPSVGAFAVAAGGMNAIGWISAGAVMLSMLMFIAAGRRRLSDAAAV